MERSLSLNAFMASRCEASNRRQRGSVLLYMTELDEVRNEADAARNAFNSIGGRYR